MGKAGTRPSLVTGAWGEGFSQTGVGCNLFLQMGKMRQRGESACGGGGLLTGKGKAAPSPGPWALDTRLGTVPSEPGLGGYLLD